MVVRSFEIPKFKQIFLSYKLSEEEWSVTREPSTYKELDKLIVTIFNRINTVKLCQKKEQLTCSCSYSDGWVIPFTHYICVATSLKPHWVGISHHDVSVF